MSADNYYLIWGRNGKFYVTMEFMSDDDPVDFDEEHAASFDTLEQAFESLEDEYSEYGVFVHESASSL